MTELASFRDQRARLAASGGSAMPPAWTLPGGLTASPPTGTVTFLLTDIEGSTPRWDSHAAEMTDAMRRHNEILDAAIASHGGFRPVEQGEGDSMLAAFTRASDAVAAAMDAQRALLAEPWPEGADIHVRMGLHTGETQLRDELYYAGPSIIRCARLRTLAHGDQVLVSGATADLLADVLPPDATLLPLGRHRLKGLRTPEEVYQLAHPDLPRSFPALAAADERPTTVPIPLTSFVGRESELTELATLMDRHRLVSLVGPGGCGKTRLSAQAASAAVANFADGVWWVELAEVTDPTQVATAVLAAISLDARGMAPLDRLTNYLAERQVLLVLDNCEQIVGAAADLVEAVLRGCPEARVLASSREPLGVPGEAAWRIAPLSLPPEGVLATELLLDQVLSAEAVQLFGDRAAQARPGFRVDGANAPTVVEICRRLDGIPLAIELAAARVGVLPPERILDGLCDRFRLLAGAVRGAPRRQRTLMASVEWSHDLLSELERTLLRQLAVFHGPFDLPAAEEVSLDEVLDRWSVLGVLASLVDKSLVGFDGEQYLMLQTIRDFAVERLAAAGEATACRDKHLAHYQALAAAAAGELAAGPSLPTLALLESARTNLLAALNWALERANHESAQRITVDLTLFWQLRGYHSEAMTHLRRVLAETPDEPSALRAGLLAGVGLLGVYGMDLTNGYGVADNEAAIAMATAEGYDEVLGRALSMRAFLTMFAAPQAALDIIAQSHAASTQAQDAYGIAMADAYAAFIAAFGCDRADLAQAPLARLDSHTDGSPLWPMFSGFARGVLAWRAGRLKEAISTLRAADELCWDIGDPTMESWCAVWLAEALTDHGEFVASDEILTRSAAWMARSSCARHEFVLSRRIRLALAQGDVPGAASYFPLLDSTVCTMGFALVNIEVECLRAAVALANADVGLAREAAVAAGGYVRDWNNPWCLAMVANTEGRVARAENRSGPAEDEHHRALALCLEHGFEGVAAETLEQLASLALLSESAEEALRLFGAAAALRERTGQRRGALEETGVQSDLSAIRAQLGDAAFEAVLIEGAALGFVDVVAYATRSRGERKRPSAGWDSLTPTEAHIVTLVAEGLTNAQIAERMFISVGTVKVHVHHVFNKLGITRRADLAARATERRLAGAVST